MNEKILGGSGFSSIPPALRLKSNDLVVRVQNSDFQIQKLDSLQ